MKYRLALLCLILCLKTAATDYSAVIGEMRTFIDTRMQADGVTGMCFTLVDGQDVVWTEGFGYADKKRKVKATADTLFMIGSISKTFAATSVMQLAEQNSLSIDDPVEKVFPAFSITQRFPGSIITLRTILDHHSGIPGDIFNGGFTSVPSSTSDFTNWLLGWLKTEDSAAPVNFVFAYNNSGFAILSELVASVAGTDYDSYARAKLFDVMGMNDSSFSLSYYSDAQLKKRLSKPYISGILFPQEYCSMSTAGSITSTANDMAKYAKMVLASGATPAGNVIKSETLGEMLTVQNGGCPFDTYNNGLSWLLSHPALSYAGKLCWHDGGTVYFSSQLIILVDQGLAAFASNNSQSGLSTEAVIKCLRLAVAAKSGLQPPDPYVPSFSETVTVPQETLDALAGIYVKRSGYDIINAKPGSLEWISGADTESPSSTIMVPRANGWFSKADSQDIQLEFKAAQGYLAIMQHYIDPTWKVAESALLGCRYVPVELPAAWIARLGDYEIVNVNKDDISLLIPAFMRLTPLTLTLARKDSALLASWMTKLVVSASSDTLGYVMGLGRNKGEAMRAEVNDFAQERLRLMGCIYTKPVDSTLGAISVKMNSGAANSDKIVIGDAGLGGLTENRFVANKTGTLRLQDKYFAIHTDLGKWTSDSGVHTYTSNGSVPSIALVLDFNTNEWRASIKRTGLNLFVNFSGESPIVLNLAEFPVRAVVSYAGDMSWDYREKTASGDFNVFSANGKTNSANHAKDSIVISKAVAGGLSMASLEGSRIDLNVGGIPISFEPVKQGGSYVYKTKAGVSPAIRFKVNSKCAWSLTYGGDCASINPLESIPVGFTVSGKDDNVVRYAGSQTLWSISVKVKAKMGKQ